MQKSLIHLQEELICLDDIVKNICDVLPSQEVHAIKQLQIEIAHLPVFIKGIHSQRWSRGNMTL
jgi:hypothetical protein